MECKPVKPLARPRASRRLSSAGSKRLRRLCFAGVLHIHRLSRRACIRACALQVKLAQVVLDKRLMGGRRSADFDFDGSWGGGEEIFWNSGCKSWSYVPFCVNVLHFSSCVIVSLYHLPFPVPPCVVTLSYIALCCPISFCVHLSYPVLPCLALSWSVVSFWICPIPSYPIPPHPILSYSIPSHSFHPTLPYPTLPCPNLSYPILSYPTCSIQMSSQDRVCIPIIPVLAHSDQSCSCLSRQNTPNRLNWTERSLAYTYSKLSSPLMFLLHFISVLVGWETSF